ASADASLSLSMHLFSFVNESAHTEIYTLSLHDALPILSGRLGHHPRDPRSQRRRLHSGQPGVGTQPEGECRDAGQRHSPSCSAAYLAMILDIDNLSKRYGNGALVLEDLSLHIEGSGITAIIGSSGAGKSTLLRCINRLVEPTGGTITLDGVDLTRLHGAELRTMRRSIGMIFQNFNLVDRLSVMENVLSGRLGYVSLFQAAS